MQTDKKTKKYLISSEKFFINNISSEQVMRKHDITNIAKIQILIFRQLIPFQLKEIAPEKIKIYRIKISERSRLSLCFC